ncbi:type II secretion system secretin GspD [Thermodesulfobacteriota bacterium]
MSLKTNNKRGAGYGLLLFGKAAVRLFVAVLLTLTIYIGFDNSSFAQGKGGKILLNFKDAPVETVLGYLSETAGIVVVYEYELRDRISVISKQPLNTEEAISLLNTILKEKGYTTILTGKTLKVVLLSEAKKMNIPVRSGNDPSKIIPGDDVVTYIIPVKYADAASLKETLATLISDTADFMANSDTNTLIITDTTANIKRLVEIIQTIDTQVATVAVVRVFHLEYAEAESTAELINEIFEEQNQSNRSTGASGSIQSIIQMRGRPPFMEGDQSSSSGGRVIAANISAKADERTNSVVVSAPQESMDVIERLIADLDSDSSEGQSVFVYPLKNARADNLQEVLTNLFNEMDSTSSGTAGAAGQRTPGQGGTSRLPALLGLTQGASGSTAGDLVGKVEIEADEDTNSLIIMTTPANYEKVKRVLNELDKPVPQVLIKVLLAEVTHDGSMDWGAEFSFIDTLDDVDVNVTTRDFGVGSLTNGYLATFDNVMDGAINFKLRALEKEGKLNILSRPYILASNNQTATITVGNEVPFIRDTRTTETGQTINTIEYEDIGIILEVTPYINEEGLVIMDLNQEISAISGESVPISETVDASVFAKRSSENRVIARNGQTVVIGGLMEDRLTKTVSKVPILGDIPLLGLLFRGIKEDTTKTELLIFLTPTVAATDEDLMAISREKKGESKLIQEAFDQADIENNQ